MSVCNRNEIYSLQTGFSGYRMLLLGSDLYGLKSPPSSTHVLMKTGHVPAISKDAGRVKSFFKFFYFAYH
jgi:hypothetical protein